MREGREGKETTLDEVALKLSSTDLVETEMSLVRWFELSPQIELLRLEHLVILDKDLLSIGRKSKRVTVGKSDKCLGLPSVKL